MRKPVFSICENKDADQHLYFRYIDSTIPLLHKSVLPPDLKCFGQSTVMISSFRKNKFSEKQVCANKVFTVYYSLCIIWRHHTIVEPLYLNF